MLKIVKFTDVCMTGGMHYTPSHIVSFAAVIRVITQRFSPLTAVSGEKHCVTTLITAAKETTSHTNV